MLPVRADAPRPPSRPYFVVAREALPTAQGSNHDLLRRDRRGGVAQVPGRLTILIHPRPAVGPSSYSGATDVAPTGVRRGLRAIQRQDDFATEIQVL